MAIRRLIVEICKYLVIIGKVEIRNNLKSAKILCRNINKISIKKYWISKTNGREDIEFTLKNQAVQNWCNNTSQLTEYNINFNHHPIQR